MKIKVIRKRNDAKLPVRHFYNDAGADVFAPEDVTVLPGKMNVIKLGFGLEIPDGFAAYLQPKSSLTAKGLIQVSPPIDSGYRGEISSIMFNVNANPYTFNKGDKIAQLVILPVPTPDYVEELGDERNEGAFGSTGK